MFLQARTDVISFLVTFQHGMPERVITDFEKAAINSLLATIPNTHQSGCFSHYKQMIPHYLRDKGLEAFMNHRPAFQYLLNLLYCLDIVPADQVMEFYEVVQNYLEAHAQDCGFQDDLSSSLTTERNGWV
jgi:hypothetical protein